MYTLHLGWSMVSTPLITPTNKFSDTLKICAILLYPVRVYIWYFLRSNAGESMIFYSRNSVKCGWITILKCLLHFASFVSYKELFFIFIQCFRAIRLLNCFSFREKRTTEIWKVPIRTFTYAAFHVFKHYIPKHAYVKIPNIVEFFHFP